MLRRPGAALIVGLLLAGIAACGGDETHTPVSRGAAAKQPASATLKLGDQAYHLTISTCDPEGTSPTGITLRGQGTTTDGRRIHLELERRTPSSGGAEHNVMLAFGDLAERDVWEGTRHTSGDGTWRSGQEEAPGPLIEVTGQQVSFNAPLRHPEGEQREASLEVRCPG